MRCTARPRIAITTASTGAGGDMHCTERRTTAPGCMRTVRQEFRALPVPLWLCEKRCSGQPAQLGREIVDEVLFSHGCTAPGAPVVRAVDSGPSRIYISSYDESSKPQ
jgi:hypothetical protein